MPAKVFGRIGTADEDIAHEDHDGLTVAPLPLPGEPAPNFVVDAVVGDDIKPVRLSDFNHRWRLLCFFPAAFTFV